MPTARKAARVKTPTLTIVGNRRVAWESSASQLVRTAHSVSSLRAPGWSLGREVSFSRFRPHSRRCSRSKLSVGFVGWQTGIKTLGRPGHSTDWAVYQGEPDGVSGSIWDTPGAGGPARFTAGVGTSISAPLNVFPDRLQAGQTQPNATSCYVAPV